MPRALRPATPSDDIAARQGWLGATVAGGVMTAELVDFCESGVAIALASVAANRRPVIAGGLGCRVSPDGRVRVVLAASPWSTLLDAIAAGGRIAATFSRPHDHRAIQLKGSSCRVAGIEPEDAQLAATQARIFADDLVDVGYPAAYAATYITFDPADLAAVEFFPDSAFVQTPGPGAGSALVP